MPDPGCDFRASKMDEPCGETPTRLLALGMTDPNRQTGTMPGDAAEFY